MYLAVIAACLVAVIAGYFLNNPLGHSRRFIMRRFLNWFPLGMTYSFLYMGRYNLNVSKNALGSLMSKEDFGIIFGLGTLVYALSFLVNGPAGGPDRGEEGDPDRRVRLGVGQYPARGPDDGGRGGPVSRPPRGGLHRALRLNMYFQSYGAVSIIKVKAYWFHVRERGVFGAIFGTLISFGVYFAFDWGQAIVNFTGSIPAVFFIPAAIIACWSVTDIWAVADTPEDAGFPAFDTHDASSGQMHVNLTYLDLLKKVFTSPLMLMIAVVELTSGIFRNGISQWYFVFANEIKQPGAGFFLAHWGWLLCIFGVVGGFAAGFVSDKFFQSRRGPPAAMLCGIVLVLSLVMAAACASPRCSWASRGGDRDVRGRESRPSCPARRRPTSAGRKATATCAGIVDGFAYLGSSIQSFSIGYIATRELAMVAPLPHAVRGHWPGDRDQDLARASPRDAALHRGGRIQGEDVCRGKVHRETGDVRKMEYHGFRPDHGFAIEGFALAEGPALTETTLCRHRCAAVCGIPPWFKASETTTTCTAKGR
jgi:MFS transporter, OPA family, glycerol-3-phosphate transporter